MTDQPPQGWRFLTKRDHFPTLLRQHKLVDLCRCGHARPSHNGAANHLDCKLCPCRRFTWKCHVIKRT